MQGIPISRRFGNVLYLDIIECIDFCLIRVHDGATLSIVESEDQSAISDGDIQGEINA
jgi:hypothetical protein